MAVISAKPTVDARKYWPQLFGGLLGVPSVTTVVGVSWNPTIRTFKVGEGGWTDPGGGRIRRNPVEDDLRRIDNNIQDLDAIVDATRPSPLQRYPLADRATFEKTLTLSDFSFVSPATVQVRCFLDFAEFNDDGFGNDPEIWEIGLFSDHPVASGEKLMVAYGNFPMEVKNSGKPLENLVRIRFGV
jgi:hypothetical protein